MTELSTYKCLVYDYGNYVEVAQRLSRDFKEVFYFCPHITNGFPDHSPEDIAFNVPGITKVKEWASIIDEVDLIVFPDSHEPHLQQYFRNIGKAVFGSVFACELEHDRVFLKETIKSLGLPVGLYSIAKGLDALEQILINGKGKRYIKGGLRGDMETWEHNDWRLSQMEIRRMKHEMGVNFNKYTYIVEHPIDSIAEIGIDTCCIDGEYLPISMVGLEVKDLGYIGRFVRYKMLPDQLREVTDKLGPVFESMGYRGDYSNEVIISKDNRGFLIDNTCRAPQPPTSLKLEAYSNYSEIVWKVANGEIPIVQFEKEWGVQLIIKSAVAEKDPSPLLVPKEYQKFVKVKNLSVDEDGTWWYNPMGIPMQEIGSVVATGDTMEEAIKKAIEVSESIQGFDISIKTEALDKAKKSLDKLKRAGINFI